MRSHLPRGLDCGQELRQPEGRSEQSHDQTDDFKEERPTADEVSLLFSVQRARRGQSRLDLTQFGCITILERYTMALDRLAVDDGNV